MDANVLALKAQGNAAYRAGKLDEALAAYDAALRAALQQQTCLPEPLVASLGETVGALYNNRAQAYLELNEPQKALEESTLALYYLPMSAKAWLRKAKAMSNPDVGTPSAALAACEAAARLDPASTQAKALLPKLKASAPQDAPELVALCAAHINNEARWQGFQQMVRSWGMQWHAVPLYVSISFDSGFTQADAQRLLAGLGERYLHLDLHLELHDSQLTQGQHYQRLTELLQPQLDSTHTWLLFSDSDDLWHEERTAAYHTNIRLNGAAVISVCCTAYVDAADAHAVRSPSCVSELVRSGHTEVPKLSFPKPNYFDEYWGHSVRLSTLAGFFSACDPAVVKHDFFDQALVKGLCCGDDDDQPIYFPTPDRYSPTVWLYYYRKDPSVLPITAFAKVSSSDEDAESRFIEHNLSLYCSKHSAYSKRAFYKFLPRYSIENGDAVEVVALLHKALAMAEELLTDPNNIYNKLLLSPVVRSATTSQD